MNLLKTLRSFGPALLGMKNAFLSENNFHVHLVAAIIAIVLGIYFQVHQNDWLWLIASIGMVFTMEYLNTAIEKLTDLVSPEFDTRAGNVKDIAAGAVLMASLTAVVIGVVVFWPYVI
ncbi:MAG TPA: diacylglycerol kinase family protein [Chitinophagales bacterium]|nr:diacylglycerol kinase family protein [Chitinophagales bacterium]